MMGVHFIYDADTFAMTDAGVVNVFVAGNIIAHYRPTVNVRSTEVVAPSLSVATALKV